MEVGQCGKDFEESAFVARSFLRQCKGWLSARFGDLRFDPDGKDYDIYLFVPGIAFAYCGGSVGAAFTGE